MTLNVDRSNSDTFYRYKMPRLVAKVEGSGNGIKTVLPNISDVGRSLSRPPTYPLKYFGYELGAQTSIDIKNERYIINGAHDAAKLQDLLDGFIQKFVLCPNCSNPETGLDVQQKKGIIKQRCAACGYQGTVDLKHRLSSYVIKNPPPTANVGGDGEGKGKKGKNGKGHRTGSAKNGTAGAASGVSKEDREASVASPTDLRSPGVLETGVGSGGDVTDSFAGDTVNVVLGSDEIDGVFPADGSGASDETLENGNGSKLGDDWADDDINSSEARAASELTGAMRGLALDADADLSEKERLDLFHQFVQKCKKDAPNVATKSFPTDVVLKIYTEADRLEVQDKAPLIVAHELFDSNCVRQVKLHRDVLLRFTFKDKKAQRNLLGGIEQLAGEQPHREALLDKVSQIFKALYDNDIVDEDVFLAWYEKPSKKFVKLKIAEEIREKAAKFITWLKEAEEEESSDEEEEANGADESDEEDESEDAGENGHDSASSDEQAAVEKQVPASPIKKSTPATINEKLLAKTATSTKAAPPKSANHDDIDIDAI